jgi:hypothetical protein
LPPTAACVRSTDDYNPAAFNALFAEGTTVSDADREFRRAAAIDAGRDRRIFEARVFLEVVHVANQGGETVVTTKVDGNFARTGFPEPGIQLKLDTTSLEESRDAG